MSVQIGDFVVRRSYGEDILFRVIDIDEKNKMAYLKGMEWRLIADAPLDDLVKVKEKDLQNWLEKTKAQGNECLRLIRRERELTREKYQWLLTGGSGEDRSYFEMPGRVLHVDGDLNYVKICTQLYDKMNVPAKGYHIIERDMPGQIVPLMQQAQPDILVITGHDSYKKSGYKNQMESYKNSKYFVETVKEARKWEKSKDKLIIFAGACQSFFEAILQAGANFASSPERINIHAQDPVYIAQKAAYTPVREMINIIDTVQNTVSGLKGIGGLETRGSLRLGIPLTEEINQKMG